MSPQTALQELAGQLKDQELMIRGLRGHVTALDHAVRLLIAGCPDIQIIRSAWHAISNDLELAIEHSSAVEGVIYNEAMLQCARRIAKQLNVAMNIRAEVTESLY